MPERLLSRLFGTGVAHGFFTRRGGVSSGIYASLNLGRGSADAPEAVEINRTRCLTALGAGALVTNYQVHGARVVLATGAADDRAHRADALVSRVPGLALGILTADCVPVLFADEAAGVVGAAHAGWRGTAAGVLEATVEAMAGQGAAPAQIRAAVGPAIAQPSYQVGADVRAAFLEADADAARFFRPDAAEGKFRFDLPGAVAARLTAVGLAAVERFDLDTYADEARFFSYRRATHRAEQDYGRQLSAILLRP